MNTQPFVRLPSVTYDGARDNGSDSHGISSNVASMDAANARATEVIDTLEHPSNSHPSWEDASESDTALDGTSTPDVTGESNGSVNGFAYEGKGKAKEQNEESASAADDSGVPPAQQPSPLSLLGTITHDPGTQPSGPNEQAIPPTGDRATNDIDGTAAYPARNDNMDYPNRKAAIPNGHANGATSPGNESDEEMVDDDEARPLLPKRELKRYFSWCCGLM